MRVRLPVAEFSASVVVRRIIRANAWFLFVIGGLASGCALVSVGSSNPAIADLAWSFTLHAVGGLLGSYVVHELAHACVLKRMWGVAGIEVVTTILRFSLVPRGVVSGWQICLVAAAGPLIAAGLGVVLMMVVPSLGLHLWYLGHVVFLLPVFGDGKSVVVGLRSWGRRLTI